MNREYQIINDDARKALAQFRGRADLIVTSPPYADAKKRHYDSIDPDQYAAWFATFHEPLAAALKPEGSLVVNIKDKIIDGVRHRYVWETIRSLERLGWYLIDDYLWHKPNAMPGYWPTRLRDAGEYCFHLARTKRPYIDFDAVKRPVGDWATSRLAKLGQNDRTRQNSANASGFGRNISRCEPQDRVARQCAELAAGRNQQGPPGGISGRVAGVLHHPVLSPEDRLIIDPFGGSGTTAVAAFEAGRSCVLIDNSRRYCLKAEQCLRSECGIDVPIARSVSKTSRARRLQTWPRVAQRDLPRLAA